MSDRARPVLAALSFLSAVPVGRGVELGERDLRSGAGLFPAVGAAIGALVAVAAWGSAQALPAFAAAVIGVAVGVGATAALHLDGLGDLADGVGASLTGGDPSEAMRDPRLGTFGIAAVGLDLLLKTPLLAALLAPGFPWPIVAAGALSRVAPIAMAWRLPYAGGGTGTWTNGVGPAAVGIASAIGVVVAIASAGLATAWMVLAVAVSAIVVGRWSSRRLGGVTGDGFGAAIELGETLALLAAVAVR